MDRAPSISPLTGNEDSHDCMTGEEFLGRNEEGDLHENLMSGRPRSPASLRSLGEKKWGADAIVAEFSFSFCTVPYVVTK